MNQNLFSQERQLLSKDIFYFDTKTTMKMIGVSQPTIYRWLREKKIDGEQSMNRSWRFSLPEINRIRERRFLQALDENEALKIWRSVIDANL